MYPRHVFFAFVLSTFAFLCLYGCARPSHSLDALSLDADRQNFRLRNHLIVLSWRPHPIRQQVVASFFTELPRFGPSWSVSGNSTVLQDKSCRVFGKAMS